MKTCTKCKEKKKLSDFSFKSVEKNIRQSRCKACMKSYDAENYKNNKRKMRQRNKKITERMMAENRSKILEYLESHACVDCGENDPVVLEFDHRRDKKGNIANMIRRCSWSTILDEIQKCDVRCANCHRRKTALQFGHYKVA